VVAGAQAMTFAGMSFLISRKSINIILPENDFHIDFIDWHGHLNDRQILAHHSEPHGKTARTSRGAL
jgi:hypothetical protein